MHIELLNILNKWTCIVKELIVYFVNISFHICPNRIRRRGAAPSRRYEIQNDDFAEISSNLNTQIIVQTELKTHWKHNSKFRRKVIIICLILTSYLSKSIRWGINIAFGSSELLQCTPKELKLKILDICQLYISFWLTFYNGGLWENIFENCQRHRKCRICLMFFQGTVENADGINQFWSLPEKIIVQLI